jgi:polysaccharide chain length determinant protein (PEP-CTERM system associated)
MPELLAEVLAQLRAVWHRRWLALGIAWLFCLFTWGAILLLPDRYQARASVFVDTSTALKPVLEGLAVGDDPQAQLLLVREALLARPNLEIVAHKSKLDTQVKSAHDMDALIFDLQTDLKVDSASVRGSDTVYTITYQHPQRDTAVTVVRTLLDDFVQGTLSGSQSGSDEAQDFLRQQIAEYESRLSDAEARLAEFKKENIGLIPGERGDYFARLSNEMNALQTAQTNLAVTESRREALRAQLNSVQPYMPGTSQAPPVGGLTTTPDVSLRLQEAQARMEELLLRFTEKHPEVIALQQTIAELKVREARELAELQSGGAGTGAIRSLSANPVYQAVQLQLNQVNVEIASLRGAIAQHQTQIAALRRIVDSAPAVEQEFARLNRDYGVTKSQYEALVKRLEQAKVSDDAAKRGNIKFNMIEPPNANTRPLWPNRPLLMIVALIGGLGFGAGFAVLLNLLQPKIHDALRLAKESGVRVLGTISRFRTLEEQHRERMAFLRFAVAASLLVFSCGALVVLGNAGARAIHQWLA